jgi:hypothetical protein
MNRRQVLKNATLMLGGILSSQSLLAMEKWVENKPNLNADFSLDATQKALIEAVAETILPRTKTPGAKDAGVPDFIALMLKDCYKNAEQTVFRAGLDELNQAGFLKLGTADKVLKLKSLEAEAKKSGGLSFWSLMKELTLLGYFTSEVGIKAAFNYTQIPGKYQIIKLKPNQKAFAY